MKSAVFSFFCLLAGVSGALRDSKKENLQKLKSGSEPPPRRSLARKHGEIIPGSYIVSLKDKIAPDGLAQDLERVFGRSPRFVLRNAIRGFVFDNLTEDEAAEIATRPDVLFVEQDRVMSLESIEQHAIEIEEPDSDYVADVSDMSAEQIPGTVQIDQAEEGVISTQQIPWGITRVNGGENYTGGNVAWILDSGIDLRHPDLNVQTSSCFSAFSTLIDITCNDRNGHGTHVAGTIGAIDNDRGVVGVAAGAPVVPVKVLDINGDGSASGVLAGLEWVTRYGKPGDVANLSLGGVPSESLDAAVLAVGAAGIKMVLAAGNSGSPAIEMSPGRANGPNVYTVSAIDMTDGRAVFSNYGSPPIDYAAPGVAIRSTWNHGRYGTISGTSMASPHVAGILLLNHYKEDGVMNEEYDADIILVNQKSAV